MVKNAFRNDAGTYWYWYSLKNATDTGLKITGGDYYTEDAYGFAGRYMASGQGDASGGKLTVTAGQFRKELYGGYSKEGRADNNTLIFSGGYNSWSIIGGYGKTGAAGNTVEMSGGEIGTINGGAAESGIAGGESAELGNKVIMSGGKAESVTGGNSSISSNGMACHNTVSISGSAEVNSGVYGGYGTNTQDNVVEIKGGTIKGKIYGGYYGGVAESASLRNKVTISGAANLDAAVKIYGSWVINGKAENNLVTIARENLQVANIYAGYVEGSGATSGNVLLLNTTGTVATGEIGANIIKVGANVAFDTTKTVAKANDFTIGKNGDSTMGTLDISEAEGLKANTSGTMTLLESNTDNDFAKLPLVYNGGSAELNADHDTQEVYRNSLMKDQQSGVTLDYYIPHTVSINQDGQKKYKKVTYTVSEPKADLTFGEVEWKDTGALIDHNTTWSEVPFSANTTLDTSKLSFTNPEEVGGEMTLLANAEGLTASQENISHTQSYTYSPLAGISMDAVINGSIARGADSLTYKAASNAATKLTFTNVELKDSGALLDHSTTLTNVDFNGAAVDTAKISFTNLQSLAANKKMTLVSDFGTSVGTITGTEYTVGTTLKGKGKASLQGNDLIFTAETGTGENGGGGKKGGNGEETGGLTAQEQTHNTVMGMEAGAAALYAGNGFIDGAIEGLGDTANQGADGLAVYAAMGGASSRQETGSHVNSHTWNAILALGTKQEKERGTLEWGGFFEYGRGNYTLHSDAGQGDGHTHYTGGGLLAKWQNRHDVYTEASIRAGRMKDTANDILRDAVGNAYGYNVHANYRGAHIGVGKIYRFDEDRNLDVYGKYFYNRRGGVSFDAGGQYDLDAVTSSILRIGARYTAKAGNRWNWYGGLAYEYEFDGKAEGRASGVPIRAASTKGGSALAEVGLHMEPTETSPWKADIGIHGSCGKHRGIGGAVSVAYMF